MILIEKQLNTIFRTCGADPDETRTLIEMTLADDPATHSFGSHTIWPLSLVMDTWKDGSHTLYVKGWNEHPLAVLKFRHKIKDRDLVDALNAIKKEKELTSSASGF